MDLGLRDKVVVVTGASRGIGRAIALEFAREGACVAVCARCLEALDETRAELEATGARVWAQACDVGDAEALDGFLEAARARLGGMDVLINNVSGFGTSDDEQGWAAGFEVDIMASVRASWKVAPWMEAQGSGVIIHISSVSGLEAGWSPAYAAAKAALVSHAKSLAFALAPKGIRVNCVAPGSIEFPGGGWEQIKANRPERYGAIRGSIPFGRLGRPEEVAAAVVFLASGRASWISGVTLAVDGVQHKGNL
ncbi:MAG TPA: SDR family oxidoreductase [Candidatus Obscuribacterales bacterium]